VLVCGLSQQGSSVDQAAANEESRPSLACTFIHNICCHGVLLDQTHNLNCNQGSIWVVAGTSHAAACLSALGQLSLPTSPRPHTC
jgi:hypothetical protein